MEKYFYRPLAAYAGKVFKCAGICDETNIGKANEMFLESDERYIRNEGNVYLPGFVVLDGYKGDKVVIGGNNIAKEFVFGDCLPSDSMNLVEVEVRNVYGNATIYPANAQAAKFAMLAGKKTFSISDLEIIKSLGFVIEEVAVKKLAA